MNYARVTIGDVELVALSDATVEHRLPLQQLFPSVTAAQWAEHKERFPEAFGAPGVWRLNVGCYLLRSQGRTVLVDAGVGPAGGAIATSMQVHGGGRLLKMLALAGIRPEEVDIVLFTHLHRDHVGWSVQYEDGRPRLTFPHARYAIHEADWQLVHRPETLEAMGPYIEQVLMPLETLGALQLNEGELKITDELTAIPTPGHTPGHRSILIASGGQSAIIAGDAIVNPAQIADPDCAFFFDMDTAAARQTRRTLIERVKAGEMTLIGGHLPAPGLVPSPSRSPQSSAPQFPMPG